MQAAGDNKVNYLAHFGLKKRLFGTAAKGRAVFVGPAAARTIAEFRKCIARRDAVVTVSGPRGCGKTALVHRALDALGIKYKTIRVGRLKMNSSEVLESLLIVLGVRDRPAGTMQRFAALRKTLKEHQERNVHIFIVIEDAVRTGIEALAEMEAMTAANAGDSDGASIVVMGNEKLAEFLDDAQLAELRQRVTQQHTMLPMSAAELRGYLVHSFRNAGGDFQQVFDAAAVELLYQLSGGIPRLANRIVEAVLVEAARKDVRHISATFVAIIAKHRLGCRVEGFDDVAPTTDPNAAANAAGRDAEATVADAGDSAVIAKPQSPGSSPPGTARETASSGEIPLLIQDTLADQKALTPDTGGPRAAAANERALDAPRSGTEPAGQPEIDFAATLIPDLTPDLDIIPQQEKAPTPAPRAAAEPPTEIVPELDLEFDEDEVSTRVSIPHVAADRADVDAVPEIAEQWEPEPAAPEFEPDLDALEQAIALANSDAAAVDAHGSGTGDSLAESAADGTTEPSMNLHLLDTLDEQLEKPETKAEVELDQVAADMSNAASLEDVDDRLAETLFGSEFRCLSDEEILELQRADAADATTAEEPPDAGQARATVIPVAREVAVGNLVSANDEDSGESENTGRKP